MRDTIILETFKYHLTVLNYSVQVRNERGGEKISAVRTAGALEGAGSSGAFGRVALTLTEPRDDLCRQDRRLCQMTLMRGTQKTRSRMGSNKIVQKGTTYYHYYDYYYLVYSTESSLTRQV